MSEEVLKQQQAEIEKLTAQVNELNSKLEESQRNSAIEAAASSANQKPAFAPSATAQKHSRDLAVKEVGGLAKWAMLGLDQRLAALGETPATAEETKLAKELFSGAESIAAGRMARQNPRQYARLRAIHRELSIG